MSFNQVAGFAKCNDVAQNSEGNQTAESDQNDKNASVIGDFDRLSDDACGQHTQR